jgi:hypothetical protein
MEVESLDDVISKTNGLTISGRAIRVNEAEEKRDSRGGGGGGPRNGMRSRGGDRGPSRW